MRILLAAVSIREDEEEVLMRVGCWDQITRTQMQGVWVQLKLNTWVVWLQYSTPIHVYVPRAGYRSMSCTRTPYLDDITHTLKEE